MRFWLSATIVPFLVQTDIRVLHQVIIPFIESFPVARQVAQVSSYV